MVTNHCPLSIRSLEQGSYEPDKFINETTELTKTLLDEIKNPNKDQIKTMNDTAEKESCGKCPDCDQLVIEFPKLFTCQNKECDFKIWKKVAQKELSQAQVKQILETGKSELIEGFTSKAGKPSSAFLEWNSEKKQTSFVFDNKATT